MVHWIRRSSIGVVALVAIVAPYTLANTPRISLLGNEMPFNIDTLSYALVAGVAILSLVVLVGYSGQLSLAAGFYMGVGAYFTTILAGRHDVPFPIALSVAGIICGLFGVALGLPALRIRGTYLALVTITLAAVFPALVRLPFLKPYTGGSNGLVYDGSAEAPEWLPIDRLPELLGHVPVIGPSYIGTRPLGSGQAESVWAYFVILVSTFIMYWLVAGVLRGQVGRSIKAVRDHEIGAAASGVHVARLKVMVFGVGGLVAGVAGGLYAFLYRVVVPETFGLTLAIFLLFGMILGGSRSIVGAIIGGFAVAYLPVMTSQVQHLPAVPDRWLVGPTGSLFLGILLILFPLLVPGGIAGRSRAVSGQSGNRGSARPSPLEVAPPLNADQRTEPNISESGHITGPAVGAGSNQSVGIVGKSKGERK